MSTHATTPAQPIPSERRASATSPPLDPSRLNQQPAPLPPVTSPTSPLSTNANTTAEPTSNPLSASTSTSVPLRSPTDPDSAYLDTGAPVEPPSHPTVAETGALSPSSVDGGPGPGPSSGQLPRRESDTKREIIKLSSFGGEGLTIKPPVPLEDAVENAIEDEGK